MSESPSGAAGSMRAARFHAARDIRIDEVPAPDGDLAPHEVLVRPRWCGICGTDLHEYTNGPIIIPVEPHPLSGAELPQILGTSSPPTYSPSAQR